MAEFKDVIKQQKRMCDAMVNCGQCPLIDEDCACRFSCMTEGDFDSVETEMIERIVMDWAEKHPEPRYPNWNEVWRQLFPNASNAPCPLYCVPAHMVKEYCSAPRKCAICRSQPIPADIAEKLGIKPIGVKHEQS